MRAIVVRHYKTLINASGQIMGWGDAPRVKGWEADLAYVDAILNERDIQFSAVYTNYLERARQTGMFYARKRGIPLVHDTPALNEINYGALYRKSKSWVEKTIPSTRKNRISCIQTARASGRCRRAVSNSWSLWPASAKVRPSWS